MLNCNCFQEVDSVQWQRVEAVVLAMPHQGTWAENDIQFHNFISCDVNILGTLSTREVRRSWSTCPAS